MNTEWDTVLGGQPVHVSRYDATLPEGEPPFEGEPPRVFDLREQAELMVWANENVTEPWDYAPDAMPGSAYALWVRAASPDVVLALLDRIAELERADTHD